MSRVIQTDGVGKRRRRLLQMLGAALRELMTQTRPDARTLDLAAFIAELLGALADLVEETTVPWEKRGYWVKADRFRMEWRWAAQLQRAMQEAVLAQDWDEIAQVAAQVFAHVGHINVPKRLKLEGAWEGAYQRLVAARGTRAEG
ncbi:MAG TPA: hypothetical protein ENJ54_08200 [Chloroflexi bacterium]|nr:hypothetical protein [Chloroflexota bacterium]